VRRDPYRQSGASITPRSLEELFGARTGLETDDGLRLAYRVLPWKRHLATLHYKPANLSAYVGELASRGAVRVEITGESELPRRRYQVVFVGATGGLVWIDPDRGFPEHFDLNELGQADAQLSFGRIRFGIAGGELRLSVSSYDPDDLAQRFRDRYPLEALGVPNLLGRVWLLRERREP
jgi:hypothetical protein